MMSQNNPSDCRRIQQTAKTRVELGCLVTFSFAFCPNKNPRMGRLWPQFYGSANENMFRNRKLMVIIVIINSLGFAKRPATAEDSRFHMQAKKQNSHRRASFFSRFLSSTVIEMMTHHVQPGEVVRFEYFASTLYAHLFSGRKPFLNSYIETSLPSIRARHIEIVSNVS